MNIFAKDYMGYLDKRIIPFYTLAVYKDDEYNIKPTFVKIMELLNVELDKNLIKQY